MEVKCGLRFGTFNIDGGSMGLDQDYKRGIGLLRADRILLPFCFIAYLCTLNEGSFLYDFDCLLGGIPLGFSSFRVICFPYRQMNTFGKVMIVECKLSSCTCILISSLRVLTLSVWFPLMDGLYWPKCTCMIL